uniref:DNA replication checkpoint mediator MRC1 domain-containing protein n=1 Tax=Strongyloides stercoralis TaxID=6248 RepID=A0A0K0E365_STRER
MSESVAGDGNDVEEVSELEGNLKSPTLENGKVLFDVGGDTSNDNEEKTIENDNENQLNVNSKDLETHENKDKDEEKVDEKVSDQPIPEKSKLSKKKERLLAKYGIDPNKKLPRKPSVYGNFVDIAEVKDESERKHMDPWLQESLESPHKKKISPTKVRTGIRGMSRAEWLKRREKKLETIKFAPIKKAEAWLNQHNTQTEDGENETVEVMPIERLSSDDEEEPKTTEESVDKNKEQENEGDGSAIYLDPDVDFMAYCRQEEEEREKKQMFEVSQLKDVNDSELDLLITQGAKFNIPVDRKRKLSGEDFCDNSKKLKTNDDEGKDEITDNIEKKDIQNEDDEDVVENVSKKNTGKLVFDDEEEEEEAKEAIDEVENEEEIEDEEEEEVNDEDIEEENEEALLALQYKKEREKKMKKSDFYDDEASLSGEDVGSDDDEDGSDVDEYEIMDGDFDEVGNQKEIVDDLAKQQMLQELKADEKRLRKIKEKLNIYDEGDPEQAAMIFKYQTRFMTDDVEIDILERNSDTEDHLEVVEVPSEDSNAILSRKASEKEEEDEWDKEIRLGKMIMEKNKAAQMVKKKVASNSIRNALGLNNFLNKLGATDEKSNDKFPNT